MGELPKIHREVAIELTSEDLAEAFCEMDDDQQAQFFVHVAHNMSAWKPSGAAMQLRFIGDHLRECECSTADARNWVVELAACVGEDRLRQIAAIVERVDNRCMAADGPVSRTLDEMTDDEMREIYKLATGDGQ